MRDAADVLANVRRGMLPAHIYNDAEVFEAEKERLFARAWMFVAHESEIPQVGDYVVRRVLDNSFIVSRDQAGEIHAMFNMCLHRGMQVCRAEQGNASHFRCPYHGWSYKNDGRIVGLPFHQEAYGGEAGFARKGQRLLPAPSLDSYNGLIFVSMDPDAPPLRGVPRRLRVLPRLLHQAERERRRGARPAALAGQGELEDRRRELRRRHVPHAPDPHERRGDRPVPRAEGREAQGRLHLLGRARRRHDVQAPAGHARGADALRRLPRRDDRADEGAVVSGAARRHRSRRLHDLRRVGLPEPQPRAQLAEGRRRRRRAALHLAPPVAADQRRRDRGAVLVRRRQGGARGVQEALLQGLPDVLRQQRHVRAGRRRELGVAHQHRRPARWPAGCCSTAGWACSHDDSTGRAAADAGRVRGPGVAHVGYGEYNQRALLAEWADYLEQPPLRGGADRRRDAGRRRSSEC